MSSAENWQNVTKILRKIRASGLTKKAIPRGFRSARNGSHQKTGHKEVRGDVLCSSLYMGSAEKAENVTEKIDFFSEHIAGGG